ncbi:MAG: hypothetical protein WC474_01335 [Hydrogenophilaceae bacterium]
MAHTIPRSNHAMAVIVDQGIVISELFSLDEGFNFLRANNVPINVALRVLFNPEQRRQYHW